MNPVPNTQDKNIDPDINELLEKIAKSAANTDEERLKYELWFNKGHQKGRALGYKEGFEQGKLEERKKALTREMTNLKRVLSRPAAIFYRVLIEVCGINESDLLQVRLGHDRTTGVPTVLIIVSKTVKNKMDVIHDIASAIEIYMYHREERDCQLRVVPEISLNTDLINHDFPVLGEI
ncbi:MAG: hypothetical protein LBI42_08820 [Chitinispirillales bacterium]|nr:hypothetical protein [Chitinispirillales bacterium]